jgi:hypothetical protein
MRYNPVVFTLKSMLLTTLAKEIVHECKFTRVVEHQFRCEVSQMILSSYNFS